MNRTMRPVAGSMLRRAASPPGRVGSGGGLPEPALWAACTAFSLFVVLGLALRLPNRPVVSCLAAAAALICGVLPLRVSVRFVALVMAAAAAGVAVLANADASNVGWFAICVLGCWCGLVAPRSHSLAFLAATLGLFGSEALWAERDPGWGAWAVGTVFSLLAALLIRHNLALVAELRAAQASLAERARTEERNRIARELHDVIGHSLTVVLLHVASARMAVTYDPADATRALAEAERLGRQTLDEVRATVGMLRVDEDDARPSMAPLPGLAEFGSLVDRFRQAGADVSCTVNGDLGPVPATVGLAVYRIAQEALTNAAKHAPGVPVGVALSVNGQAIELVVANGGGPVPSAGGSTGMGLLSMRERAEALGGVLTAGPAGPGFEVRGVLPLDSGRRS